VSLLGSVLTLHDPACRGRCVKGCIRDVERLCGEALERRGIRLGNPDYEDKLSFAISECWIIAGKYEPAKDGTRKNMAAWVFFRLGQRLVDPSGLSIEPSGNSRATSTNGNDPNSSATSTSFGARGEAHRATTTASTVNWATLSPRARATLRQVEVPISLLGYSPAEVSATLGISISSVNALRAALRDELSR
jgi:hypothetical protein